MKAMSIYNSYKPLRNLLRKTSLMDSLQTIWQLSLCASGQIRLPLGYIDEMPTQYIRHLFPWTIELLCREVLLNSGKCDDRSLRKWRNLRLALRHITDIENDAFKAMGSNPDVMIEILRIANRQFPHQSPSDLNTIMRTIKIFGTPNVDIIVRRVTGMSAIQHVLLGLALNRHFSRTPLLSKAADYSQLGITNEVFTATVERLSIPLKTLQKRLEQTASYDCDWAYTWNALEETPLITTDQILANKVFCPLATLQFRRMLSGLYYDLCKERDFSNAFGDSFSNYIGDIIKNASGDDVRIQSEQKFRVGRNVNHGADWIWSDQTANVFIEAKAKRLSIESKTRAHSQTLNLDISILADAVTQNYQNINLATDGCMPHWKPDNRPIYSMVVTLEDWHLYGTTAEEILLDKIHKKLLLKGISRDVIEQRPFLIISSAELEVVSQVMLRIGLAPLLDNMLKRKQTMRHIGLLNFIRAEYPTYCSEFQFNLFEADFSCILNDLKRQH